LRTGIQTSLELCIAFFVFMEPITGGVLTDVKRIALRRRI